MNNKEIIEEFIKGTPEWLKQMEKINEFNGNKNNKICCICGIDQENISKLLEAVKELKEKAWKYDELCK